jgi:hypothetical protein
MIYLSALCGLLAALLLALPQGVGAFFEDTIQHVAGPLSAGIGGAEFGSIYRVITESFIGIVTLIGIVMIIRAGLSLTLKQEEGGLEKARNTIIAVGAALIIINLAPRIADAFLAYQGGGAGIIETEVRGLLSFFESLAAITAIIYLIVSGIRAVISYGGEEGTTHLKRAVIAVGSGLLLIAVKLLILDAVVTERTPGKVLLAISRLIQAILGLGAFAATIVLIWAGLLMILNLGKEDQYTRAKTLVIRVAIGLIVILVSLAVVQFVIIA